MKDQALRRFAKQKGIPLRENEPMNNHTTFQIGGPARFFAMPKDTGQLVCLLEFVQEAEVNYVVIGRGSNLLVSDQGYDGLVILCPEGDPVFGEQGQVIAAAGCSLARLSSLCARQGLAGLTFAQGIPGTVGGGVVMNAGAYGGQLSDYLRSSQCYTPQGIRVLTGEEHAFGYRESVYAHRLDWVVLLAEFQLPQGDPAAIQAEMADYAVRRREKQPLEYPSAGSTFRRPKGYFAGKLIEDCGLKGLALGGAQVSQKHAGFIVNRGGATCADVLALMEEVSQRVYRQFGVMLEPEVKILR